MPVPHLAVSTDSVLNLTADVLLVAVRSSPDGARVLRTDDIDGSLADALDSSLASIGFRGVPDEVRRIPAPFGSCASVALVGIGRGDLTTDRMRYAAGTATRQLTGITSLVIAFPVSTNEEITAALEGAAMGAYRFTTYRSSPVSSPVSTPVSTPTQAASPAISPVSTTDAPSDAARTSLESVVLATSTALSPARATDAVAAAAASSTAVATVRDLVNIPASDLYPASFAERAVDLAKGFAIEITVLDEKQLAEQGFGGIVGVGQGSARGPRLVKAVWNPEGAHAHLALVGKGITFDSGGLSLKPPTSMVGMKYDMTGAATALAVIVAAARLALPVRLTAWMCLAENMPSGTATRPGDVLTLKNGRTVEVLNTDAEGRLVLADGLVAASAEHPDAIIDIATLTGAASVALGNRYVAAMGDPDLVARVVAAADRTGETLWPMPLPTELRALLDSDIADMANVKIGNTAGGMLIAGVFLQEFVGQRQGLDECIPWVHLDIAGAANNALGGYGYIGKGSTGVTVRALIEVASDLSREG